MGAGSCTPLSLARAATDTVAKAVDAGDSKTALAILARLGLLGPIDYGTANETELNIKAMLRGG